MVSEFAITEFNLRIQSFRNSTQSQSCRPQSCRSQSSQSQSSESQDLHAQSQDSQSQSSQSQNSKSQGLVSEVSELRIQPQGSGVRATIDTYLVSKRGNTRNLNMKLQVDITHGLSMYYYALLMLGLLAQHGKLLLGILHGQGSCR